MGIIEYMLIFCITTAIVGNITMYTIIHSNLKKKCPTSQVAHNPILGHILFFTLGLITAPFLFLVIMISSVKERFINTMVNSLVTA